MQPVATIEAVPLDLVVEIKTPNQANNEETNEENVHSNSAKHQNNSGNVSLYDRNNLDS